MNEYAVGLRLSEKKDIIAQVFVEAADKDEAEEKALTDCKEEGITVYGICYCDFIG